MGTDGGTDQDVAAASGLPEDDSEEDDDEEDDEFEVADSLDLGAVALCVSLVGATTLLAVFVFVFVTSSRCCKSGFYFPLIPFMENTPFCFVTTQELNSLARFGSR